MKKNNKLIIIGLCVGIVITLISLFLFVSKKANKTENDYIYIKNNLSIKKLMKSLNISEANYYRWKNNFNKPAMYSLISIAKFFDVSIDYLVGHCK